jgi:hypothetical protein
MYVHFFIYAIIFQSKNKAGDCSKLICREALNRMFYPAPTVACRPPGFRTAVRHGIIIKTKKYIMNIIPINVKTACTQILRIP